MKAYKSFSMRLALFVAAIALSAFAGVKAPFVQFADGSIHNEQRPEQDWLGAQMISLSVKGGTSVWLSNYVNSWYDPKPIPGLDGNVFQMGANQYGYLRKSEVQAVGPGADYSNLIHWANGASKEVTYTYDPNPNITNSTTAYYLDYFGKDDEIYFVMTTLAEDGGETVDSFQYVNDPNSGMVFDPTSTLVSRVDGTKDLANNIRINFGVNSATNGLIGREFVAIGSFGDFDGNIPVPPSGQPLPGALFAGLLSMGTVLLGKRLRRNN